MGQITPRAIVYDAFRALGVLRPGQQGNPDAMDDALRLLNDMLDAWQLERLMIYGVSATPYTIPSGSTFTIGPGGTLGATRPVRIESAGWLNPAIIGETPVPVLTDEQRRRGMYGVWSDNGYPVVTLQITPAPVAGSTLNLWAWAPIAQFGYLDDSHDIPPGYARALRWNLANEIAASALIQRKIPEVLLANIQQQAIESKAAIKSFHSEPTPTMDASDGGALGCGCGETWNIRTDRYY